MGRPSPDERIRALTPRQLHTFMCQIRVGQGLYDCWHWDGLVNRQGYGVFKGLLAHRIAHWMATGELPQNPWVVAHICFNKTCVSPRHLRTAHKAENNTHADQWRTNPRTGGRFNVARAAMRKRR